MLAVLNIMMFIVPALVSLIIHNYLRHGELSGKRKIVLFFVYFFLLNGITFAISYVRGVKGIRFSDMTFSYRLKYMSLGGVLGFVMPFVVALITEDVITIGGFIRYERRFFRDLKKYNSYAVWSAKSDLKAEVASSYLNWMWWLIEPFCMMLIYSLIFGVFFKASEKYFSAFIFIGLTMWGFFSRTINGSVATVRSAKNIITKVYIPKYIILFSKMLVNAFKMMVSFGVIVIMMIYYRVPINWNVLWVIPILLNLFLFTFGVGTIMMHYGVFVNDLGYITGIVLQMMMFLSGIFYSISKRVPEPFGEIIEMYNPMAFFISFVRSALLYGTSSSVLVFLVWAFISLVLISLGVFTIYSNENAYVKVI